MSFCASGCSLYGLFFGIPQTLREPLTRLFARNHFHLARAYLVHSSLNFVSPGGVSTFIRRRFVQTLNQSIDQQAALVTGQFQCFVENLGNFRTHLCHMRLTSPFYLAVRLQLPYHYAL